LASAWIGLGAGLLPARVRGGREIVMLALYGIFAALAFGFLMNLSFWPFTLGEGTETSFVPGAPMVENLQRFVVFTLFTSTVGWDAGRAITTTIAVVVLGPAILGALRRASRRAAFEAPVHFDAREQAGR